MKRFKIILFIINIISLGIFQDGISSAQLEAIKKMTEDINTAPDFSLMSLDDSTYTLSNMKNNVVLVNFWATWCGPCRIEIPDFNDLYRKYSDKDFEILGVSISDSERQLIDFKNGYNVLYPLLWGDQITTQNIQFQYGINSIPVSFLVNKNSEVIRIYPGAILKQYDVNMYTDLILNIEKALSD